MTRAVGLGRDAYPSLFPKVVPNPNLEKPQLCLKTVRLDDPQGFLALGFRFSFTKPFNAISA